VDARLNQLMSNPELTECLFRSSLEVAAGFDRRKVTELIYRLYGEVIV